MGATPSTIPTLTAAQFAQRLAAVFPPGWSAPEALLPGGVARAALETFGAELSFMGGSLSYALAATRLQTAQGDALDAASVDFFGTLPPYALPRNAGELDPAYRTRLLAAMLPPGATRAAMAAGLLALTGFAPRLIEFWRPADTGAYDMPPGTAMAFWDVDVPPNCFRWTDWEPYQALIEVSLPQAHPFGNNPTPCFDTAGFYWDTPNAFGAWFIDVAGSSVVAGVQQVYNAINRLKCEGTICWTQFVQPPGPTWDQPGLVWDAPGGTWT